MRTSCAKNPILDLVGKEVQLEIGLGRSVRGIGSFDAPLYELLVRVFEERARLRVVFVAVPRATQRAPVVLEFALAERPADMRADLRGDDQAVTCPEDDEWATTRFEGMDLATSQAADRHFQTYPVFRHTASTEDTDSGQRRTTAAW